MWYAKIVHGAKKERNRTMRELDGSPKISFWKFFIIVFVLMMLFTSMITFICLIYQNNHPELFVRESDIEGIYYYDFGQYDDYFDSNATKISNIRFRQYYNDLDGYGLPVMLNDTIYEVDKQCFHQIDYESSVSDVFSSSDDYVNGYLDWDVDLGAGATIKLYGGSMKNPETPRGISGNNMYVRVGATVNGGGGGWSVFTRNFTQTEFDVIEFNIDFSLFATDQYKGSVIRWYNGVNSTGKPIFSAGRNADATFYLQVYNETLGSIMVNSSIPLLNELNCYAMIKDNICRYVFYDYTDGVSYEINTSVGNSLNLFNQIWIGTQGETNTFLNIDNIGIYINGSSIINNEYGYAEMRHLGISDIKRADITLNGTVCCSNTQISNSEYIGYIVSDDSLSYKVNHSSTIELLYNLDLDYDSVILTLGANDTFDETSLSLDINNDVFVRNNSVVDSYLTASYGANSENTSYFYSINRELNVYCNSTSAVSQGMTAVFDITNFDATNTTIYVNELYRSSWMFNIEFRVYFTDNTYFSFELDDSDNYKFDGSTWKSSFAGYIPNYKTVDYINLTVSPNSNAENTFLIAGLKSIEFRPLYETPFNLDNLHDTGILSILVPIVALLVPSFIIPFGLEQKRKGMAKKTFIPVFLLFTIILFATGTLPAWLFFVCLVAGGTLIFVMRQGGTSVNNINLGLSLQAKKDKLAKEQQRKKDIDFKKKFKYEISKAKYERKQAKSRKPVKDVYSKKYQKKQKKKYRSV